MITNSRKLFVGSTFGRWRTENERPTSPPAGWKISNPGWPEREIANRLLRWKSFSGL